jgi:hypothetical protein
MTEGTVVDEFDADIVAVGVDGIDLAAPLNREDALELTSQIRAAADLIWVLIARAHAGRAWEALGYPSWEAYVREEFNISRSRAYQILDQGRVIQEISAAAPVGTHVNVNERQAREIKRVLGEVVGEVKTATAGMSADQAEATIDDILAQYRDRVADGPFDGSPLDAAAGGDALEDWSDSVAGSYQDPADAFLQHGSGGPSGYAPSLPGGAALPDVPSDVFPDGEGNPSPHAAAPAASNPSKPAPSPDLDPALIRRNVQACYDLYASLSSLKAMPAINEIIATIPAERRDQVTTNLGPAMEWLSEFAAQWRDQPWQAATSVDDDPYDDQDAA